MRHLLARSLALFLIVSFTAEQSFAIGAATGLSLSQELGTAAAGSEYVSGNFPGAILMPVNLWGPVGKPGIHHIPTHTDLITLLSLAGGPQQDAQLDRIVIKRRNTGEEQVIKVDVDDLLGSTGRRSPTLEANDIIVIPRDKPSINPNTLQTIGFISSVVGLILAGFALNNQIRNK